MEAEIAGVSVNDEGIRLLMTILGVDYFTFSSLMSKIYDINRFRSMVSKI